MDIDLRKLVRISDFAEEDKKKIIDGFDTLSAEALLELWNLCLENLQWKVDLEFSKRFYHGIVQGVKNQKDTNNYTKLEKDILLELFTRAEMEIRQEEIAALDDVLKKHKKNKQASHKNQSTIN